MKNFKSNDSRGRDFKRREFGKGQFGDRNRERPQMHEAICSDCGKRCQVPFRPTGDKPVYCNQCFSSHGGSQIFNRPERRGPERPRFQGFRPTGDKPAYSNERIEKSGNYLNKNNNNAVNQYKEQFDMLNTKLDRIIKVLTPAVPVKEEKKDVIDKFMAKGNNSRRKEIKKPKKNKKK